MIEREHNYDFLKRMREIHAPGRRCPKTQVEAGEFLVADGAVIAALTTNDARIRHALADFQDYLSTSMGVSARIAYVATECELDTAQVVFRLDPACPVNGERDFILDVSARQIAIRAKSPKGLLHGAVHCEDRMNFRGLPALVVGTEKREWRLRRRSVHSGSGIDDYPDWQLNAILHAGFTAIELFIKAEEITARGYCNINDLIDRAEAYGLEVSLYNYISSFKHPDDPDAEEFFDRVYGDIFRKYPKVCAFHLCGESLEFPSKDPATTGKRWHDSVIDGIPDTRPSPGWHPCCDYPKYLGMIRDAIHRVNPEVEIVFSTYNWSYAPWEIREKFLENFPKNMTLALTFEICQTKRADGLVFFTCDYTAGVTEPSFYFTSEAKKAKELGIRVRATANTAGATWDFGAAPYVPAPYLAIKKLRSLERMLTEYNVDFYYDNHHYGWWPCEWNDLAKALFLAPAEADLEAVTAAVARRDYGSDADAVLAAWRAWSDAMEWYVASNEDQYGPWRVGPAYPLIFQPNITRTLSEKEIQFPTAKHAHFGHLIIKTLYQPYENINQSPGPLRYPVELKSLQRMLEAWNRGMEALAPVREKSGRLARLYALGMYIRNSIRTVIHTKEWWLANMRLQTVGTKEGMLRELETIERLAHAEMANARDTFEAVDTDSRLGWEASMEYVADRWHLEWKIRQVESALREIATYRTMLDLK